MCILTVLFHTRCCRIITHYWRINNIGTRVSLSLISPASGTTGLSTQFVRCSIGSSRLMVLEVNWLISMYSCIFVKLFEEWHISCNFLIITFCSYHSFLTVLSSALALIFALAVVSWFRRLSSLLGSLVLIFSPNIQLVQFCRVWSCSVVSEKLFKSFSQFLPSITDILMNLFRVLIKCSTSAFLLGQYGIILLWCIPIESQWSLNPLLWKGGPLPVFNT